MDDPYKALANAIVIQAAADYRANPKLRKRFAARLEIAEKKLAEAQLTHDEELIGRAERNRDRVQNKLYAIDADQRGIERFFRSEWFRFLTDANGELILQQLQAEARE